MNDRDREDIRMKSIMIPLLLGGCLLTYGSGYFSQESQKDSENIKECTNETQNCEKTNLDKMSAYFDYDFSKVKKKPIGYGILSLAFSGLMMTRKPPEKRDRIITISPRR